MVSTCGPSRSVREEKRRERWASGISWARKKDGPAGGEMGRREKEKEKERTRREGGPRLG
jgi:hypothetical protein